MEIPPREGAQPSSALQRRLVLDRAVVREARLREHFVGPVDLQLALVDGGLQEIEQVARVHLARVVGELTPAG